MQPILDLTPGIVANYPYEDRADMAGIFTCCFACSFGNDNRCQQPNLTKPIKCNYLREEQSGGLLLPLIALPS